MDAQVKYVGKKHVNDSDHDSDEADDEYCEEIKPKPKEQKMPRTSVSAEVYGVFNKKEDYIPRVIAKSEDQIKKIQQKLNQTFMFSTLDDKEKKIVVDAMEVINFKKNDWIIKQGEDGDLLYVVESGTLKCFKKFANEKEPKYLKTYVPGESFGELALLYNAPRAASIQAESDTQLFALDRECFNKIVRDAAFKKREKYEKFLLSVELLQSMDPYERVKIADALVSSHIKKGEYVMKQGEKGDCFFFLEEGEAVAMKVLKAGDAAQEVFQYKAGDYFGELALLKDQPRQASVLAKTDIKVVSLDRESFKRLIGPLDEILKRNIARYEKYM